MNTIAHCRKTSVSSEPQLPPSPQPAAATVSHRVASPVSAGDRERDLEGEVAKDDGDIDLSDSHPVVTDTAALQEMPSNIVPPSKHIESESQEILHVDEIPESHTSAADSIDMTQSQGCANPSAAVCAGGWPRVPKASYAPS